MIPTTLITCIAAFIAGVAALYLVMWLLARRSWKKSGAKHTEPKKGVKTMDVILVIVGAALLAFTIKMIQIYEATGMEPSTLETCVFSALGGECGIMGWIKTAKERYRDREWQKEDNKPPNAEDFPTNNL